MDRHHFDSSAKGIGSGGRIGGGTAIRSIFSTVIQEKVGPNGLDVSYLLAEDDDFKESRTIIRNGLMWGSLAGMTQFFLLRRMGMIWMRRKLAKSNINYARTNTAAASSTTNIATQLYPSVNKRSKDGRILFREGLLLKVATVSMDLAASLFTGSVVTIIATDRHRLFRSISDIPLKEGRSSVSDLLCSDLTKMIPVDDISNNTKSTGDKSTDILIEFVENCYRREHYENKLRKEPMMDSEQQVSIPSPGVPKINIFSHSVPDEHKEYFDG